MHATLPSGRSAKLTPVENAGIAVTGPGHQEWPLEAILNAARRKLLSQNLARLRRTQSQGLRVLRDARSFACAGQHYHRHLAEERPPNSSTSAIWISLRKGHGKPLSYQAFESSLRVIGRKFRARFHAHLFRHTLAQAVLETTGNLKVTQELLGHAQLSTTADQYARDRSIRPPSLKPRA